MLKNAVKLLLPLLNDLTLHKKKRYCNLQFDYIFPSFSHKHMSTTNLFRYSFNRCVIRLAEQIKLKHSLAHFFALHSVPRLTLRRVTYWVRLFSYQLALLPLAPSTTETVSDVTWRSLGLTAPVTCCRDLTHILHPSVETLYILNSQQNIQFATLSAAVNNLLPRSVEKGCNRIPLFSFRERQQIKGVSTGDQALVRGVGQTCVLFAGC